MRRFWRWLVSLFRSKPESLYMGVSVFTGWASPRPEYGQVPGIQCPVEYPWRNMRVPNRVPAIGEYDETLLEVTVWRLGQMQKGKIDWVTYQHEWSPHLGRLIMNHCAENHPADSPIQFAMSCWDVQAAATDELNLTYWDSTYRLPVELPIWTKENISAALVAYGTACALLFTKASYLRIDGKPVLFRGCAHALRFYERFGLTPKAVLNLIAHGCGVRPYFVATACEPQVHPLLKSWGFDAFTEYNLYAGNWPDVALTYRDYWNRAIGVAKETGIDYWVPASTGFDDRAWSGSVVFMPTPAEFTEHLQEARQFAHENYRYTRGRVLTNNWSEYGEGSVLEPMLPGMLHDGDDLLMAHAEAVT